MGWQIEWRTSCAGAAGGNSSQFSGTGSNPNFRENGWHRARRFKVSQEPRATPNRSMASYEYREQVGSNRQLPANSMDRYAL